MSKTTKRKTGNKVSKETQINQKSRFFRVQLLSYISVALVLFGFLFVQTIDDPDMGNTVTGFVSSDVFAQKIDIEVEQSQTFNLVSNKEFRLTSLRLSGSMEGEGLVEIYLEDPYGEKFLVYHNVKKREKGNLITGYATAGKSQVIETIDFSISQGEFIDEIEIFPIADNQEFSNEFYQECLETCFLSLPFAIVEPYSLLFHIQPGVKLDLNQIIYTTE